MNPLISILSGLILIVPLLQGQNASEEEIIQVSFTTLSIGRPIRGLMYESDGRVMEMQVNNGSRSSLQRYKGSPRLVFFRQETTEGEPIRVPVGMVDLSGQNSPLLLLFLSDPNYPDQERYRILPLNDSLQSFPSGSYSFINMTNRNLAAYVDGDTLMIPAYGGVIHSVNQDPDRTIPVKLASYNPDTHQWVQTYESKWQFRTNQRVIVFISRENSQEERMNVQRVVQVISLPDSLRPPTAP